VIKRKADGWRIWRRAYGQRVGWKRKIDTGFSLPAVDYGLIPKKFQIINIDQGDYFSALFNISASYNLTNECIDDVVNLLK